MSLGAGGLRVGLRLVRNLLASMWVGVEGGSGPLPFKNPPHLLDLGVSQTLGLQLLRRTLLPFRCRSQGPLRLLTLRSLLALTLGGVVHLACLTSFWLLLLVRSSYMRP